MKFEVNNETLTIFLSGRIDSASAPDVEAEVNSVIAANPHTLLVFDADALEFISSAGLRVILRVLKSEPALKIINASTDVYDIFDMTGFTEMLTVEKGYRRMSVDGCTVIGRGAKGTVYRYNADTIIKVYKNPDSLPDIKNERELARRAFVLGIPTAISYDVVKVGDSFGSVFELLDAKSYSQLIAEDPDNFDKYVTEYALLVKKIHSTAVKETDMPHIKKWIYDWVEIAKGHITDCEYNKLKALIDEVPEKLFMLHCDYHTNNVMSQNGETLLIDMDTLSHGHPVFELANVYVTYVALGESDPTIVENFIGLPYDKCVRIWDKFIKVYLDTEDEEKLAFVTDKVKLVAYLRLFRHMFRRQEDKSFLAPETAYALEKLKHYIAINDTIVF